MCNKAEPKNERAREVFRAILVAIATGLPPTQSELADTCGMTPRAVWQHVRTLEKLGYVRQARRERRGIMVLDDDARRLAREAEDKAFRDREEARKAKKKPPSKPKRTKFQLALFYKLKHDYSIEMLLTFLRHSGYQLTRYQLLEAIRYERNVLFYDVGEYKKV